MEVEEEGHFKTLRDFKVPSIDELLSDEALYNTGLSQANPRGEDEEVFVCCRLSLAKADAVHSSLSNEADHEVAVRASHADGFFSVRTGSQAALCAHFCEEKESPSERQTDRRETGDDGWTGNGMRVGDVRPARDLVDTARVLQGDRVAWCSPLASG